MVGILSPFLLGPGLFSGALAVSFREGISYCPLTVYCVDYAVDYPVDYLLHYPLLPYCWWLKSCTTWDVWNPINNGINYLSTGAGFQPSTVWQSKMTQKVWSKTLSRLDWTHGTKLNDWMEHPWKFLGKLEITQLKRKIIWTKPPFLGSMLIFQGVLIMNEWCTQVTNSR